MATIDPTVLTKDVWTKVLTAVTTTGKVVIMDIDPEPTEYLVAMVTPTGDPAPSDDYAGGIPFKFSVNAQHNVPFDMYIKPLNHNGLVMIFA